MILPHDGFCGATLTSLVLTVQPSEVSSVVMMRFPEIAKYPNSFLCSPLAMFPFFSVDKAIG